MISFNIENLRRAARHGLLPDKLDYHLRKGMTLEEVERWLGPNLNYDPAAPASAGKSLIACACGTAH